MVGTPGAPPLGHCPRDVIHIFQGWNKIAEGWNKIAKRWNKIAKGWNKIAKGWNKIFGMGNWGGGRPTPPWLRACTYTHTYIHSLFQYNSKNGLVFIPIKTGGYTLTPRPGFPEDITPPGDCQRVKSSRSLHVPEAFTSYVLCGLVANPTCMFISLGPR